MRRLATTATDEAGNGSGYVAPPASQRMTQVGLDEMLQASTHIKKVQTELSTHGNQLRQVENGMIGMQTAALTNTAPDVTNLPIDPDGMLSDTCSERSFSIESQ